MTNIINSFSGEYRFLSNFFFAPVFYDGYHYLTIEHAYQAAKTVDYKEREEIRLASRASLAKKLGQKVTLRDDWEAVKVPIMTTLVIQKFAVHKDLRSRLLATQNEKLIEGNTWGDTFWGVCNGRGQNKLGKILMLVRGSLK